VKDEWAGPNYFWFQLLAQKGYIIVSVDNRGTGARGEAFNKCIYKQLGHLETIDQIETAKWLGKQTYVDASRIGAWGWSYGGYMTSLLMTKGADFFKAAVAVAPVTNWKYYDTIYTERYLQTPQLNPKGYDDNSPINYTNLMKGNYLIIHGTTDDNVHMQNAMEMVDALVKDKKQFDSFFYPNKAHGISGVRLHLYQMMTDWFMANL
jgi:dipeptidyl-peptidase-4